MDTLHPLVLPCDIPGLVLAPAPGVTLQYAHGTDVPRRVSVVILGPPSTSDPRLPCILCPLPEQLHRAIVHRLPARDVLLDLTHEMGDFLARRWLALRLGEHSSEWEPYEGIVYWRMGTTLFFDANLKGIQHAEGFTLVGISGLLSPPADDLDGLPLGPLTFGRRRAWALRLAVLSIAARDAAEAPSDAAAESQS